MEIPKRPPQLATGVGVGLRAQHYPYILENWPDVAWFEAISENFMFSHGRPRHVLSKIRERYPLAIHGVSLSIGSDEELDLRYLERLREFVDEFDPFIISDHICWTGLGGHNTHDLLPLPMSREVLERIRAKVSRVQDLLKRELVLENASTYVAFRSSEMSEPEFLNALCEQSGCGLLLDINNVFVNAHNHGFDAVKAISAIDSKFVRQLHIAGHMQRGDYLFDTHEGPIITPVWELFRHTVRHVGLDVPTLIEWDSAIPEFPMLLTERDRAAEILEEVTREAV